MRVRGRGRGRGRLRAWLGVRLRLRVGLGLRLRARLRVRVRVESRTEVAEFVVDVVLLRLLVQAREYDQPPLHSCQVRLRVGVAKRLGPKGWAARAGPHWLLVVP